MQIGVAETQNSSNEVDPKAARPQPDSSDHSETFPVVAFKTCFSGNGFPESGYLDTADSQCSCLSQIVQPNRDRYWHFVVDCRSPLSGQKRRHTSKFAGRNIPQASIRRQLCGCGRKVITADGFSRFPAGHCLASLFVVFLQVLAENCGRMSRRKHSGLHSTAQTGNWISLYL